MKPTSIPPRDPLVARTTEKLLDWADMLLVAARVGPAELVICYETVLDEMGDERARLREDHIIIRCTEATTSISDRPTAPPRMDTLPSPAATPILPKQRPRRPVKRHKPKRRKLRRCA